MDGTSDFQRTHCLMRSGDSDGLADPLCSMLALLLAVAAGARLAVSNLLFPVPSGAMREGLNFLAV